MKLLPAVTLTLLLLPGAGQAEDFPAGRWVFSRDESIASLVEAGKSKKDAEMGADMLREATIDFTEESVRIDLTEGFMIQKCGWEPNDKDEIILTNCLDSDGKPVKDDGAKRIDWMDDESLHVYEADGSKVIFRKK
ncbi:hypothetical protein JJB09_03365 [Rhizobium sp. KVB221]|uniref:DUF3617 family protein n=1 Tax=Rhizobium setariae TaxID=2801340 RepID=A0A936YLR3_9HYPH|nr:hypothetical protein [Rhizobium setariae]MBL0371057.1 hypothetical protein [Rhizobium setariae]